MKSYPNSLVHFKYFLGCVVCVSNGSIILILFIVTHGICVIVTRVPVSIRSLAK